MSLITTLSCESVTSKELYTTQRSFWELESLGIQTPNCDPVSDQFASSVAMKDGRYEVSPPWREYHCPLPDNPDLSRRCLHGFLRRLKQEPIILRDYDAIISDQLERGIVEIVEDQEGALKMTHYLPHHAVIRRDKKTTKVRVVYDASARLSGPSHNTTVHRSYPSRPPATNRACARYIYTTIVITLLPNTV